MYSHAVERINHLEPGGTKWRNITGCDRESVRTSNTCDKAIYVADSQPLRPSSRPQKGVSLRRRLVERKDPVTEKRTNTVFKVLGEIDFASPIGKYGNARADLAQSYRRHVQRQHCLFIDPFQHCT